MHSRPWKLVQFEQDIWETFASCNCQLALTNKDCSHCQLKLNETVTLDHCYTCNWLFDMVTQIQPLKVGIGFCWLTLYFNYGICYTKIGWDRRPKK